MRAVERLCLALYAFVYAGWLVHRSAEPILLGYSAGHLGFLALAALPFAVPALHRVAATRIGRRGVVFAVVPSVLLLMTGYLAFSAFYYRTRQHPFDPFLQITPPSPEECQRPRAPKTFRVLTLGGSTTEDLGKAEAERWPNVLQALLHHDRALDVEVLNRGRQWYTSRHSLIDYVSYCTTAPDVVVVMHGINDMVRSFSPREFALGGYRADYSHFYGPDIQAARPPTLEHVIGDRILAHPRAAWFSRLREPVDLDYPAERFVSLGSFDRYLRRLVRVAAHDRAAVVLVTQPTLYKPTMSAAEADKLWLQKTMFMTEGRLGRKEYASPASLARAMHAFNDVVRTVATSEQATLADPDAQLPKDLVHFTDDCHFTPTGSRIVAQIVNEAIRRAGLLDPQGNSGPEVAAGASPR
jgi:lysophospholipase L1-like esterase